MFITKTIPAFRKNNSKTIHGKGGTRDRHWSEPIWLDKLNIIWHCVHKVEALGMRTPKEIFPEYYIIRVNEFNDVVRTPLEEWIDYLKNGNVRSDTTAPGLQEVRSKLQYLTLDDKERRAYERHLEDQMIQNDVMDTARMEGRAEGIAEGRKEGIEAGRKEERLTLAKSMKADGMPVSTIEKYTNLTAEEISKLWVALGDSFGWITE